MLSNTATPKYYGEFRDAVIRGEIPVCQEISMEMNRIDDLIRDPRYYYDDKAVEGWIEFCNEELTLTDGRDLHLLDSFKLWGEQVFGWYYFSERSVYKRNKNGRGGHYEIRKEKKRLTLKQYLIVARGAAKSMYGSTIQNYYLNVDASTTHQITTSPTMNNRKRFCLRLRLLLQEPEDRYSSSLQKVLFRTQPEAEQTGRSLRLLRKELRTSLLVLFWRSDPCRSTNFRV